jgi:hypothetical protein
MQMLGPDPDPYDDKISHKSRSGHFEKADLDPVKNYE